jgi:hypothetical protein
VFVWKAFYIHHKKIMKLYIIFISSVIILTSCSNSESRKKAVSIAAHAWISEPNSNNAETSKVPEIYSFAEDGKYTMKAGDITVVGKWKWTKKDEIFLQINGIANHDKVNSFDVKQNYYIRITELTDNTLRTLERHEKDSWESGFAEEKKYNQGSDL